MNINLIIYSLKYLEYNIGNVSNIIPGLLETQILLIIKSNVFINSAVKYNNFNSILAMYSLGTYTKIIYKLITNAVIFSILIR